MNAFGLAIKVLRIDRRTRTSAILTAIGVAIATGLVLLLVSLPGATQSRAQRTMWQEPSLAGSPEAATLSLAGSTDYTEGEKITRVDAAPLSDQHAVNLPAGVPELPDEGEVLVSPRLAEKMRELPASELADRFGGNVVGQLGEDSLAFPGQLTALVGHAKESMPSGAKEVPGFPGGQAEPDPMLQLLSGVGVVVLLVPSLVLVASASRLTATRREQRLAALRLAGATPKQVTTMVAAETTFVAIIGSLAGLATSPLTRWLATFVPWDGGTWRAGDFALSPWLSIFVALVIPLLVALAGVLGLRRVVRTPLGAAQQHRAKPLHWWRIFAVPVAGLLFFLAISTVGPLGGPLPVFGGLALLIGSAMAVGPWITAMVGRLFVRVWRRPAGLLAGRRLTADPRGAYRASAGVVLAVFAGSMALTLMPSFEALSGSTSPYQDSAQYLRTDAERSQQILRQTNDTLANSGIDERAASLGQVWLSTENGGTQEGVIAGCSEADALLQLDLAGSCTADPAMYSQYPVSKENLSVSGASGAAAHAVPLDKATPVHEVGTADTESASPVVLDPRAVPEGISPQVVTIAVPTTPQNKEIVRSALIAAGGGDQVLSREITLGSQRAELDDLRRVTVIGLVAAAMLAGCSAAITTAGSVLDRRRAFGSLIAAGTSVRVLARALRTEAALPALVATTGAGVVGVAAGIGLFSLIDRGNIVLSPLILAPVALGAIVAVLAASVCTPALKRVSAQPLADE